MLYLPYGDLQYWEYNQVDPELEVNELLIIAHSGEKRGTLMFLKDLFQEEGKGKHFLFA